MPRCASKVTLHVYAIDHAPEREKRPFCPCGFGNFWCLFLFPQMGTLQDPGLGASGWLTVYTAPPALRLYLPSDSFIFAAFKHSVPSLLFPSASAVVPLDTVITSFCSLWTISLAGCVQIFFIVSLFFHPPISTRQPSSTEIREEKPLCRQKAKP